MITYNVSLEQKLSNFKSITATGENLREYLA